MGNKKFNNEQVLIHVMNNVAYTGTIRENKPTFLLDDWELREIMKNKIENVLPSGWKAIHDKVSDGYKEYECVSLIPVEDNSPASESTKEFALKNVLSIIQCRTRFSGFIMNNSYIEIPFAVSGPEPDTLKRIRESLPSCWSATVGQSSVKENYQSIIVTSSQF